jgi:tetratricopeptide (TPR) repeat protein
MPKYRMPFTAVIVAAVILLALYGCGSKQEETSSAPVDPTAAASIGMLIRGSAIPTATAANPIIAQPTATNPTGTGAVDLYRQAISAMGGVTTYHLVTDMQLSANPPTYTRYEGDVQQPDRGHFKGTAGESMNEFTIIGNDYYLKEYWEPGYGHYSVQSTSPGANLISVGGFNTSIFSSYIHPLMEARIVGDEMLDGVATTHISFSYPTFLTNMALEILGDKGRKLILAPEDRDRVSEYKSASLERFTRDFWIEKSTGYIYKVKTESILSRKSDKAVLGRLEHIVTYAAYSAFNKAVASPIAKPSNVTEMSRDGAIRWEIPSVGGSEEAKAEEHYNLGYIYYKHDDDLDAAIKEFNLALTSNPDHEKALFYRAAAYTSRGQLSLALSDYTRAIKLNPNYASIYYCRAVVYEYLSRYDQAIADYTQAIKLDPDSVWAYSGRGEVYRKYKHDLNQAIADYKQVIKLDPTNMDAYTRLGWAFIDKSDYDSAILIFSKAIQINPTLPEGYNNRGWIYSEMGESSMAIEDFTQAIQLYPEYLDAYQNRAYEYENVDNNRDALADFKMVLELSDDPEVLKYTREEIRALEGE